MAQPPTYEEFDEWVRHSQRHEAIPSRLREIKKWIADIRAKRRGILNKPDVRLNKRFGGTFINPATDLDRIARHVADVRSKFEAGEFLLALSNLQWLNRRVDQVKARVTRRKSVGGKEGGTARAIALGTVERHAKIRAEWKKQWKGGRDKVEAYKRTAKICGVRRHTVERVVAKEIKTRQ